MESLEKASDRHTSSHLSCAFSQAVPKAFGLCKVSLASNRKAHNGPSVDNYWLRQEKLLFSFESFDAVTDNCNTRTNTHYKQDSSKEHFPKYEIKYTSCNS